MAQKLAIALVLTACSTLEKYALEQRVQQLEDEKEIREVIIRYGEYLDARDYAGYASLFASDGVWTGGFGSAVLEHLAASGRQVSVKLHGVPDRFIDHGLPSELFAELRLDGTGVAEVVREFLAVHVNGGGTAVTPH